MHVTASLFKHPPSPDALQPLRITGMRAYTHEVDQREVVLDLNIRFSDFSDFLAAVCAVAAVCFVPADL